MRVAPAALACLLLSPATDAADWIDRVVDHVANGRERAGAGALERRAELDAVASVYAREVAARPHAKRLVQERSISRYLEDADIGPYRLAKMHLDMGRGYRDYGEKFVRSWKQYRQAWESAMDPRFDAAGFASARGSDDWVVFVAVLVEDIVIPTDLRALERRALEGVNEVRIEHGLEPLEYHEKLTVAARDYSQKMARYDFFSHTGADGSRLEDRAEVFGLGYRSIAENLHSSRGHDDPVPVAIDGWMKSRGHRKNILNDEFTHTGTGVAMTEDGQVYFTQLFMLPKPGR